MKHWLPFNNQNLFYTEVIYLKHYDFNKWIYLKDKFPNIIRPEDQSSFQEQIQRLKYNFLDIKADAAHYSILEVWRKNKSKFPLLFDIARAFLVVPYSSCSLERTFAKCNDIKTLKRNRLSISNLESCLLIKQEYGTLYFEFSPDMFSRFNKNLKINESTPTENEIQITEIVQEKSENEMEIEGETSNVSPTYVSQVTESIFHAATKSFEKIFDGLNGNLKRPPSGTLVKSDLKKGKPTESISISGPKWSLFKEDIQIQKEEFLEEANNENYKDQQSSEEMMMMIENNE